MKFIRESKYRHVFGDAWKEKYEDLRIATKATEGEGLKANGKWLALSWQAGGGGQLAVLNKDKTGRMLPGETSLITGHSGAILDWEFNPFDADMVATAAEDCAVRIWQIPSEGFKQMKEPVVEMKQPKKVSLLAHNPCASNILGTTAYDYVLRTLNVETQSEVSSLELPDLTFSIKWNNDGSLISASTRDKSIYVADLRSKSFAFTIPKAHGGAKSLKATWLDDKILTTGFSSSAERQMGLWDLKKPSEPMLMQTIDQGTGALYPMYDPDCKLLYLSAKGDGNVRFFEYDQATPELLHYLDDYSSTTPQKGFTFLPKWRLDTNKKEIMRFYKLDSSAITPISFIVPRKAADFQEDLYPDTYAGLPSLTADEWCGGLTKGPVMSSMDPAKAIFQSSAGGADKPKLKGVKELKEELAAAQEEIAALKLENDALKKENAQLKGE